MASFSGAGGSYPAAAPLRHRKGSSFSSTEGCYMVSLDSSTLHVALPLKMEVTARYNLRKQSFDFFRLCLWLPAPRLPPLAHRLVPGPASRSLHHHPLDCREPRPPRRGQHWADSHSPGGSPVLLLATRVLPPAISLCPRVPGLGGQGGTEGGGPEGHVL